MEAPFLWLRLVVAAVAVAAAMVVVDVVLLLVAVLAPLSALREGREREFVVVVEADEEAASANVARAGVDGLLARPLLVVLTRLAGVGWMARAAVASFLCGPSSSVAFVVVSFLPFCAGSGAARGGSSVSGLSGLGLFRMGMAVSFCVFASVVGFATVLGRLGSGVPWEFPFGLFDATDGGRWRAFSAFDCVEFWRAREDAGLGAVADGAGEPLPVLTGSGNTPMTGEDVTDGDMAAAVLL